MKRRLFPIAPLLAGLLLAGCARSPYTLAPGALNLPAAWPAPSAGEPLDHTATGASGQQSGQQLYTVDTLPHIQADAPHPEGRWWQRFGDGLLDSLINQVLAANPTVQEAVARVQQARSEVVIARSFRFPAFSLQPYVLNNQYSANRPNIVSENKLRAINRMTYALPLEVSYEIDLWGRISQGEAAARATYQATQADYGSARLALAGEAAAQYVTLRVADQLGEVLRRTRASRLESLQLTQSLFKGGLVTEADVTQAESELASVDEQLEDNARGRQLNLNALSALCGGYTPLSIPVRLHSLPLPDVPVQMPTQLLRNRPDVAAAERRVLAAGATAGAARAAMLPRLTLTGSVGILSEQFDKLVRTNSTTWLVGPTLTVPLFGAGRNRANVTAARSQYEQGLAVYRSLVLTALREVEDGMNNLRHLAAQAARQDGVLGATRRTAELIHEQYRGGLVTYLQVVSADRDVLAAELFALQLFNQRLVQTIYLCKATGGGWQPAEKE